MLLVMKSALRLSATGPVSSASCHCASLLMCNADLTDGSSIHALIFESKSDRMLVNYLISYLNAPVVLS